MKKKLIYSLFFFLPLVAMGQSALAQDYNTAVCVNLGADMGFAVKHFLGNRGAIEAQAGYNIPCKGVMLSAVYQYHVPLVEGFKFYAGGGLNIGALHLGKHGASEFAIGIDPTVGFEYKFAQAPIAVAVDYKPNINFTPHSQWDLAAFKIRYTF